MSNKKIEDLHKKGLYNATFKEPVPGYIETTAENVTSNNHNAWIILGRDRFGSTRSGYGALTAPPGAKTGAIDLVVGLGAPKPIGKVNDQIVKVDKNFMNDSARIYISQKADIDRYFNLKKGKVGMSTTRSAVGIKADQVRIIAREGIKLVTGTDLKNSLGGDLTSITGIDLIAGNNDSDMQPIVKGKNLMEALERILHHIEKLNGIVDGLIMTQAQFNAALATHFHQSPFGGQITNSSIPVLKSGMKTLKFYLKDTKSSLVSHRVNLLCFKATFLTPAGDKWILSRWNHTN